MFTLITVSAVPSFFSHAGQFRAVSLFEGATAADALRIARERAACPRYHAVGIRVGNGRKSRVLWVK